MKFFNYLLSFITVCFLLVSCKKKEEDSCGSCPVGGGTEPAGFSYTKNGATAITADSASYNAVAKSIISYKGGIATRVYIKTTSQLVGTYSFSVTGNTLNYNDPSTVYVASGGNINITSNASNKLSGNFTSTGSGGGLINVNGQFKDIPKR
jgi:hypothetical protein